MSEDRRLPCYGADESGCWLDSHRGQYIGVGIIDYAISDGWPDADELKQEFEDSMIVKRFCGEVNIGPYTDWEWWLTNHPEYHDITDGAEDYMNGLALPGYYFGNEEGDWGLWPCDREDDDYA